MHCNFMKCLELKQTFTSEVTITATAKKRSKSSAGTTCGIDQKGFGTKRPSRWNRRNLFLRHCPSMVFPQISAHYRYIGFLCPIHLKAVSSFHPRAISHGPWGLHGGSSLISIPSRPRKHHNGASHHLSGNP